MERHPLSQLLSRFWWLLLLRGILAILFGITAIASPGLTVATLVLLFAAYALVDGVFEVIHAIGYREEIEHWGMLLIEGLFGIAFGVLAFRSPQLTTAIAEMVLALYMASWAIVTGAMRIALAVRLRKEIEGEWLLGLSGVVSICFGLVIMARPAIGVMAVLYFVAFWAILLGVILLALALKAKKIRARVDEVRANVNERLANRS